MLLSSQSSLNQTKIAVDDRYLTRLIPQNASVRLQNLIKQITTTDHTLSSLTVSDYIMSKCIFLFYCYRYKSMGKKTINEWCNSVDSWIEEHVSTEKIWGVVDRDTLIKNINDNSIVRVASFPSISQVTMDWVASLVLDDMLPWASVGDFQYSMERIGCNTAREKEISSALNKINISIIQANSYNCLLKTLQCRVADLVVMGIIPFEQGTPHLRKGTTKTDSMYKTKDGILKQFAKIPLLDLINKTENSTLVKKVVESLSKNIDKNLSLYDYLSNRNKIIRSTARLKGVGKTKIEKFNKSVIRIVYILLRVVGINNADAKNITRELCFGDNQSSIVHISEENMAKIANISRISVYDALLCIVDLGFNALKKIELDPPETIDRLLRNSLTKKEHLVIQKRYGLEGRRPQTLEQIGIKFNVTRERIRQIEVKSIKKLKAGCRIKVFSKFIDAEKEKILNDLGLSGDYVCQNHLNGWKRKIDGYNALGIDIVYGDVRSFLDHIMEQVPLQVCKNKVWLKRSLHSEYKEQVLEQVRRGDVVKSPTLTIRALLASSTWPMSIETIHKEASWLTQEKIREILEKDFGAQFEGNLIVSIKSLSPTARCTIILRTVGRALSLSEMRSRHLDFFKFDMKEHNIGATLQRMDNALIVDRGTYDIYENLSLSANDINLIRDAVECLLDEYHEYTSTKVLFKNSEQRLPPSVHKELSPYILLGICQDDERFDCRRGFMIGLTKKEFQAEFMQLGDTILEIVSQHGPISAAEIHKMISHSREVFVTTIGKFLYDSEFILAADRGIYDTVENVLGSDANIYPLAIQVALVDGEVGIPLIATRLSSVGFDYNTFTLITYLASCDFAERDRNTFALSYYSPALIKYNSLFHSNFSNDLSPTKNKHNIISAIDDDALAEFVQVDYRLHIPVEEWKAGLIDNGEDNGIIDSILSEFDF